MVDLHAHTDCSDGTLSPCALIDLARRNGLSALAITDHDTLAGYDAGLSRAAVTGLDLICGCELSAKFRGKTIHLLAYFLHGSADSDFRRCLDRLKRTRRERNRRLAEKLQRLGPQVTLEEAETLGRDQTGRPHFARLLMQKGYVSSYREAFSTYLDENAPAFVPREEPSLEEILEWIRQSQGLPAWAHPGRFVKTAKLPPERLFREISEYGVLAIEAYHRDHTAAEAEQLCQAARSLGLAVTGGSDFHGPTPGGVPLGGLKIPESLLDDLRSFARRLDPPAA